MRIAVTGGRAYGNQARVDEALDMLHRDHGIELLIHGAATGADSLAADWARRNRVEVDPYAARWDDLDSRPVKIRVGRYGPYNALAGFARNIRMLEATRPDLLVVFPGGRGTTHCHGNALKMGIPSLEIHEHEEKNDVPSNGRAWLDAECYEGRPSRRFRIIDGGRAAVAGG